LPAEPFCSSCAAQESVRTASQSLARTLVKFIERVCDSRLTSAHDVRDALAEVVPVLLTKVGFPARRLLRASAPSCTVHRA
jgi:hypothetical protein